MQYTWEQSRAPKALAGLLPEYIIIDVVNKVQDFDLARKTAPKSLTHFR